MKKFKNKGIILFTCFLLSFGQQNLDAQVSDIHVSLLGSYGLILTPSARKGNDRELNFNIGYFPKEYRILTQKPVAFNEWHTNVNVMFLPFLELTATLLTPDNLSEQGWGVGDRSYKAKLHVLKEKQYRPAIAIGIQDPFGANTNQGAVFLVGSKVFRMNSNVVLDATLGYGFDIQNDFWVKTKLFQDNAGNNRSQLKGVFGGMQFVYKENYSIIMDYDTKKVNLAVSSIIYKYFSAQLYFLDLKQFTFGISGRFMFGNRIL